MRGTYIARMHSIIAAASFVVLGSASHAVEQTKSSYDAVRPCSFVHAIHR